MNRFIFTSSPLSQQMALNEIKKYINNVKLVSYISPGLGLVEVPLSFNEFSNIFKNNIVIFIRHIFPVIHTYNVYNKDEFLSSLNLISDTFISCIDKNKSFSVQTRILTKNNFFYKKSFVNNNLSNKLMSHGYQLDVKKPNEVVSIIITDTNIFFGISNPIDNLSYWPGGEYRFKKNEELISRAEFKLLEVLDMYNISLNNYFTALDLGASPGGWTKVLLNSGLKVTCVDPASLSESLNNNKNIIHHKCLAQEFLKSNYEFDIIVNDMKMDIYESINLMKIASRYLTKKDSIAIMTLKLKEKNIQTQVNKALSIISKDYKILHAKQLFHNRSEVTIVLGSNI